MTQEQFTTESFIHRHESVESFEKELQTLGFKDITGKYYWHPLADKNAFIEKYKREPTAEDVESDNLDIRMMFHKVENDARVSGYGRNNNKEVFYTLDGKVWYRDLSQIDISEENPEAIDKLKDSLKDLDILEGKKTGEVLNNLREYNDYRHVYMSNGEEFVG